MQVIVHRYKFADGWIRTVDLWCRKQPLFQLRHNHLTYFQLLFKTHFYCLSKLYILHFDKRTSWENAKLVTQNLREWTFEEKKFFFFFLKKEIEKNLKQLKRDFIAADICLNVPIFLYLFLSIFLSFAIFLSFSLSIYLSIYLSIHPSIYPSIYLSIYLSLHFILYLFRSISLSFHTISSSHFLSPSFLRTLRNAHTNDTMFFSGWVSKSCTVYTTENILFKL